MRLRNIFLALLFCLAAYPLPLFAQSTFGSIVGTVLDSQGAAIASASIQLTNIEDNTTRDAQSDGSGSFELLNLKPGKYTILTTKSGFGSVKDTNVTLDARQQRRIDVKLEVASTQETLEVNSDSAVVNTENATISQTLTNREVTELPSNYRGATTSPLGAIVSLPDVQQDSKGNISLAGGLISMADYTLDGISTVNVRSNGPNVNMYPSSEMLSEFRVSAINNNAEFASAGDVTVTSKSGTNTVHGSLFEYLQNRALDATTYGSPTKQGKVWNTFGGSVSGPVVVPHLYNGRDRTFFFFDFEANRHPGSTLQVYNVPTAAMRAGNLDGVGGSAAVDPSTGLPFPGNQIPSGRISSVTKALLSKYYPAPNYASGSTTGNYRAQVPLQNSTNGYDIRGDHNIGTRQQIAVRWSWKNLPYQQVETLLPSETIAQHNRNLLVSHNFVFTPNLLNEFRFGLSHWENAVNFPILGTDAVSSLGLTGLNLTNAQGFGGFPGFDFSDGTGFTSLGLAKVGPTNSSTTEFTDNISWIKGRHTVKAGVDYRHLNYKAVNNFAFSDDFGSFVFSQNIFSGNAFADLLLGLPFLNFVAVTGPNINQSSGHFSAYAQDEFRLTDKLTVSYGLRWELLPPFSEASGNIANFNPATGDVVVPDHTVTPSPGFLYSINACPGTVPGLPCTNVVSASKEGLPQGLRYTYWKNFDPRISAAWRPFGNKTVFRAGLGVYTVSSLGAVAYQLTGIASTDFRTYVNIGPTGAPLFQFPQAIAGNGGLDPSLVGTSDFFEGMDPHFRDPASAQFNVTIERELSSAWSGRISYIGMNSYRLPFTVDLNQAHASTQLYNASKRPYLDFARMLTVQNAANSNYQAFEAQATHRLSSGLYLQGTYTLAKNIGNAGGDAPTQLVNEVGFVNSPSGYTDRFNTRSARGNDASTRRHRFLLTSLYELPFGNGKPLLNHTNRIVNGAVGGWQLSTITLLQTGPYETPTISPSLSQANLNEVNRGVIVRPDRIGSCKVANPTPNGWFNINAFTATPTGAGRLGNSGVGICEGPGTVAVSGGLSRSFPLYERLHGRFEATFTNILNHPNFAPPPVDVSNPATFGVTQTVQNSENAGNRVGQLSLRLDF